MTLTPITTLTPLTTETKAPIIYFILKNIYHDYSKTNIQDGG